MLCFFRYFILATIIGGWMTTPSYAVKVFRDSDDGAPTNLDPAQSSTVYSNKVVTAVYDTLYEYKYLKRPYELKPNLAEGLPQVGKDGLTYTFKIKKGVYFIDDPCFKNGKGREVTADDFVYSIKRHFDPEQRSQGAWLWQGRIEGLDAWKKAGAKYEQKVSGLYAQDRYTIIVKLTEPFPQILYTFAMGFSAVVPREAVEKYGPEFSIHPVGSGPFKLVSHSTKKTVLERNPKFRKETLDLKSEGYEEKRHGFAGIKQLQGKQLPIVDRVEISWMKEPISRWNSFNKGNETVWTVLQNEQMDEVLASRKPVKLKPEYAKRYHFRESLEAGFVYTNFNMDDPQIGSVKDPKQNERNKALRCAIRKAFNWPQRIQRFYLGIGEAYPGVIPPVVEGFDPKMSRESVTHDPKGAKELLAKYGWNAKNLPVLEYSGVASVRNKQFFEQFRGWLTQIGYPRHKIRLKTYATFGDYAKAIKQKKVMLIGMGWGLDYPDAENTLGLFYGPNESPGSNSANYKNSEFDKLFAKARTMQPSEERTKLYRQLNQMIVDDCVTISGFSRTRIFLWHKDVTFWPQRDLIGNVFKYVDVADENRRS